MLQILLYENIHFLSFIFLYNELNNEIKGIYFMSRTQKKLLFFSGVGLIAITSLFLFWKLLIALGVVGISTTPYTRSAAPHGFIWVLFIPAVATSTLFLGIARTKK